MGVVEGLPVYAGFSGTRFARRGWRKDSKDVGYKTDSLKHSKSGARSLSREADEKDRTGVREERRSEKSRQHPQQSGTAGKVEQAEGEHACEAPRAQAAAEGELPLDARNWLATGMTIKAIDGTMR